MRILHSRSFAFIRGLVILLLLTGCKPPDETRFQVIVGAVLIDGAGSPPISRSVVVIAGSRIRAAGSQAATPIPAGSDKYNGTGKFLIPLTVAAPANLQLARITTLAEAQRQIDAGAKAVQGMIADTEDLDPAFLHQLRNLQFVFFPQLDRIQDPAALARARRNTRRLAAEGVPIGALGESPFGSNVREWESLAQAGLTPVEVLHAATRHAARGIGQQDELGVIAAGRPANLMMLAANPLEDARNLARVERIMRNGAWVE